MIVLSHSSAENRIWLRDLMKHDFNISPECTAYLHHYWLSFHLNKKKSLWIDCSRFRWPAVPGVQTGLLINDPEQLEASSSYQGAPRPFCEGLREEEITYHNISWSFWFCPLLKLVENLPDSQINSLPSGSEHMIFSGGSGGKPSGCYMSLFMSRGFSMDVFSREPVGTEENVQRKQHRLRKQTASVICECDGQESHPARCLQTQLLLLFLLSRGSGYFWSLILFGFIFHSELSHR